MAGAAGPFKNIKLKDISDYVANPERANTINTHCFSCHSEITRRLKRGFVKKPTNPLVFAYQVQDNTLSGVSGGWDAIDTEWDLVECACLGWGPGNGKPTIVQRGANEATEWRTSSTGSSLRNSGHNLSGVSITPPSP